MGQPKPFPNEGLDEDTLFERMDSLRENDANWRDGRVFSLVYHAGEDVESVVETAYRTFLCENALNPTAFGSLKRMENEVVSMVADLLGGDDATVGNMTSGGTESILLAVKTARDYARAQNASLRSPEMILPVTAHPAFDKASHYFGVDIVRVPVDKEFRADVKAVKKAISKRTVLMVGSAPQYPHGVVDPIEEMAALAHSKGILFHVDSCVGGMMLPFVRELGYEVPPFDLSVEGVTSLSVDLHKFGYAAKGASVLLYRNAEIRKRQYFAYTDWPGGIYASPSILGTRPGGAIAAAWAVVHYLGRAGYREIVAEVMETRQEFLDGVERIPNLHVLGEPAMSVMSLGSDEVDIYEVADHLTERGWTLDRQQNPASIHITLNRVHVGIVDELLRDLRVAVRKSRVRPVNRLFSKTSNRILNTAVRALPRAVTSRLTGVATSFLGVGQGGDLPERTAPMYGLMASLPNRDDIKSLVIDLLDGMTRLQPDDEE